MKLPEALDQDFYYGINRFYRGPYLKIIPRMISIVYEEGSELDGGALGIVIDEFRER
jgi:hypothetical protein